MKDGKFCPGRRVKLSRGEAFGVVVAPQVAGRLRQRVESRWGAVVGLYIHRS